MSLGVAFQTRRKAGSKNSEHYFHRLNNRVVSTYFHGVEKFGTAEAHLLGISEGLDKHGFANPEGLVVRLRAPGGELDTLREYIDDTRKGLAAESLTMTTRVVKNSDGSIDAELRIDTKETEFRDAVLSLGEAFNFPKGI